MKNLKGINLSLGTTDQDPTSENAPKTMAFLAEIAGIGHNEVSELRIFSLVNPDGKQVEAVMPDAYWTSITGEKWLKDGSIVQVEVEIRKKGSTTYKDKDGNLKFHTKDGNSISRINKGSASVFAREVKNLEDGKRLEGKLDAADKTMKLFLGLLGDGEKVNQEAAAALLGKIMAA